MTSTPIRGCVPEGGHGSKGAIRKIKTGARKKSTPKVAMKNENAKENAKECQHLRGGVCILHGPGAKMKYKPKMTVTTGPDGKKIRTMTKEHYYQCDLAPPSPLVVGEGGRGGKLRQTQLSFVKTTSKSDVSGRDTRQGEGGDFNFSSTNCTVGQDVAHEEHLGM